MKNYATILMMAGLLGTSTGFAQNAVNHPKTVNGAPCVTMGPTTTHHHKKHHVAAKGVAAAPKHHPKAVAHHHHAVKPQPVMKTLETISVDDHLSTAIVSIKNGEVYINDSLVTSIKNPQCEDHRLIINFIAPPPPAPVVTETIETIKTNTYTGEKSEGMLGVWGTSNCCEEGVVVDDVMPGGPACKAGLRRGDVITKINDQKISDGNDLKAAIASLSAGDNVAVTVRDYDGTETKHVELAKKDMPNNCGCSHEMWSACR